MDVPPEIKTCRGVTAAGTRCTRTANAQGYCFQHSQVPQDVVIDLSDDIHIFDSSNSSSSSQQQQRSSSGNISQSQKSSQQSPSSSDSDQQSQKVSSQQSPNQPPQKSQQPSAPPANSNVLNRCTAISRSTREQCKHHVSFPEESMCANHGGRQKAPLRPLLPQCQAIANLTRQQCTKKVSIVGQSFCPQHFGASKVEQRMIQRQAQAQQAQQAGQIPQQAPPAATAQTSQVPPPLITNDNAAWMMVWVTIITFLVDKHPINCPCIPTARCQTMTMVRWMMSLMSQSVPRTTATMTPQQLVTMLSTPDIVNHPASFWAIKMFELITTDNTVPPNVRPTPHDQQPRPVPSQTATSPTPILFRMASLDSNPSFLQDDNLQSPL
jgi:hypothetical protein